jgi:hypothetical protein
MEWIEMKQWHVMSQAEFVAKMVTLGVRYREGYFPVPQGVGYGSGTFMRLSSPVTVAGELRGPCRKPYW